MARFTAVFPLLCVLAQADPPGAAISRKVTVPAAMRSAPFDSDRYLTVPPGFDISVWARLPQPRLMAIAPNGDVFISQPGPGSVTVLRPSPAGGSPTAFIYATGLTNPHGLAFDTISGVSYLYVAESNRIDRYVYQAGDTSAPRAQVIVASLPDGTLPQFSGGYAHPLKSIAIGPDHTIYITIGSSCNVCAEDAAATPIRGAIYSYNPDGSGSRVFARGLRNAEGLAFLPGSGMLWAAVNNRDEIPYPYQDSTGNYGQLVRPYVDDHPPDLLTAVRSDGNYGWPFCNSTQNSPSGYDNMPFDIDLDTNRDSHVNCPAMDPISKGIQAHSAPLGLSFLQGTNFAAPYRNGAVIGFHGSWDRTVPTGYEVAYFPWDPLTQTPGRQIDLVTGFPGWGRPVDAVTQQDGSLLISDDLSGSIYKLNWSPSAVSAASGYPIVAPNSYAAVYGSNLSSQTATAQLSGAANPSYPATLGGVSLILTDSAGQAFTAPLVYTAPSQINFIVPAGAASGTAHLVLKTQSAAVDLGAPEIRAAAPGLFTLSGDGTGIAAATAMDAGGNPIQVFQCSAYSCAETPINAESGPVYLTLYATGIRGADPGMVQVLVKGSPVPVLFAGAQPTLPGLDQVNIQLPAALAGSGEVTVQISIGGVTSNAARIAIR